MGAKLYVKLYELSRLLLNFFLFNVIWFMLTIPIWIIGIQLMLTEDLENLYILIPLLTLLLPLVFFPPTQALFATMREILVKDDWVHVKVFFTFYKASIKNSLITGIIFTGMTILLSYLIYLSWQWNLFLMIVTIVALLYLFMFVLFYFFMESHFKMPLRWKLKQSLLFVMGNPVSSIGNFLVFILLPIIIWNVSPVVCMLIGVALTFYFTTYLFILKYNKLVEAKSNTVKE